MCKLKREQKQNDKFLTYTKTESCNFVISHVRISDFVTKTRNYTPVTIFC